ncbi:MAG: hypothetical protein ACFCUQ_06730 [Kiloniellales bacterium]
MSFRRLLLPIAAFACFALPALAEQASDRIADGAAGSNFTINRVTFDDPPSSGASELPGLIASLDRARRNGLQGGPAPTRTISLEQSLRLVEWRHAVVQELRRVLP